MQVFRKFWVKIEKMLSAKRLCSCRSVSVLLVMKKLKCFYFQLFASQLLSCCSETLTSPPFNCHHWGFCSNLGLTFGGKGVSWSRISVLFPSSPSSNDNPFLRYSSSYGPLSPSSSTVSLQQKPSRRPGESPLETCERAVSLRWHWPTARKFF